MSQGVKDFFHQWRILAISAVEGQKVYYWLDFYLPSLKLAIEADGEIWHTFFDSAKKDRKRDILILEKYGIKKARLTSFEVRAKRIKPTISKIIVERRIEVILQAGA